MNWTVLRVEHAKERHVAQQIPGSWYPIRVFVQERDKYRRNPKLVYTPLVHGMVFVPDIDQDHLSTRHVISHYSGPGGVPMIIPYHHLSQFREACESELGAVERSFKTRMAKRHLKTEKRQWHKMDMESLSTAFQSLLGGAGFGIEELAA